jgi:hypothetical protein
MYFLPVGGCDGVIAAATGILTTVRGVQFEPYFIPAIDCVSAVRATALGAKVFFCVGVHFGKLWIWILGTKRCIAHGLPPVFYKISF